MITDWPLFSRIVFYPRPTDVEPSFPVDVNGVRLGCHLHKPYPDAGLVLYFHGNGELAVECDRWLASLFLDMGVNVCFAEYRGYGASGGTPALAAMLGDGQRIVEALGMPPERVVVFGRSLGSLYAIELARRLPRLAGLIVESGIANLLDLSPVAKYGWLGRGIATAMIRFTPFNHRRKMKAYAGPVLILHAAGDQLVVPSHAERLTAWSGSTTKRLVMFPRGNHNTILTANVTEYVRAVSEFLQRTGIVRSEAKADGVRTPA